MALLLSKCSQNGLTNCILEPPNITYLQPSIRSKPVVFQLPPRCLFNIRSTGKPYSSYPVMMFTAKPSSLRPGTYAVVSTTKATRRPFWSVFLLVFVCLGTEAALGVCDMLSQRAAGLQFVQCARFPFAALHLITFLLH